MKMRIVKLFGWAAAGIAAVAAAGVATLAIQARTVGVPPGLGVSGGRLAACPDTPNCVSSQADPIDLAHYMPPVPLSVSLADARQHIGTILAAQQRVEVLRDEPTYVHAVFRSATFGFPDDVEFYIDEPAGLIHFRSASRLGRGDLGINRTRMEQLSAELMTAMAR